MKGSLYVIGGSPGEQPHPQKALQSFFPPQPSPKIKAPKLSNPVQTLAKPGLGKPFLKVSKLLLNFFHVLANLQFFLSLIDILHISKFPVFFQQKW